MLELFHRRAQPVRATDPSEVKRNDTGPVTKTPVENISGVQPNCDAEDDGCWQVGVGMSPQKVAKTWPPKLTISESKQPVEADSTENLEKVSSTSELPPAGLMFHVQSRELE
jgi:hypothetical protein